jgi:hypothetical protein
MKPADETASSVMQATRLCGRSAMPLELNTTIILSGLRRLKIGAPHEKFVSMHIIRIILLIITYSLHRVRVVLVYYYSLISF